ncbi:unnamed protein product [Debaryomyces tyrocola]|nr:unnamed protein product [Debaryomyces tyrocola]
MVSFSILSSIALSSAYFSTTFMLTRL